MASYRATLGATLAAAALVAAGCGGEPAVDDPDGVLRVALTEFRVEPGAVRTRAGRVRLRMVNRGRLTHNLAVVTVPEPGGDEEELGRTDTAFPGQAVTEREPIKLRPGRYRLACTLANHDNLGQYAELEVVEPSAL
jgi:hypothetical protein